MEYWLNKILKHLFFSHNSDMKIKYEEGVHTFLCIFKERIFHFQTGSLSNLMSMDKLKGRTAVIKEHGI